MTLKAVLIFVAPLVIGVAALFVGAYGLAPSDVIAALTGGRSAAAASVVLDVRLPRVILAGLVGASLAGSGATLQAVFRNPLVDPFLLGISSGAALGCAIGVGFLPFLPVPLLAFLFGLGAVALTWGLGRGVGGDDRLSMVLAGVVVSALFTALVSLVKVMVDPLRLQSIVFWLMGSFSLANWRHVAIAGTGAAIGLVPMILFRWRLNMLSLGDEEAAGLGIDVRRMRFLFVAATTLAAATAVSVSGVVGWIGLMVPHLVRMATGPDHCRSLPLSIAGGAAFMIAADTLARSLVSWEVPVGIVTALAGAPFFAMIMRRGRSRWAP